MLLTIHYPIADLRRLVEAETDRLAQPSWPLPLEQKQFVRFLGPIESRPRGGLNGWGDDFFCVADRGIRFVGTGPFVGPPLRRHFAFRRFFFDGQIAARFELGVALVASDGAAVTGKFIDDFLSTPLAISDARGGRTASSVAAAANPLRSLYQRATTKKSAVAGDGPAWRVASGRPVLYLEHLTRESIDFPYPGRPGPPLRVEFGLAIEYREVRIGKTRLPLWVTTLQPGFDRTVTRHLRLSILRLHTEYECLGLLFENVSSNKIAVSSEAFRDCTLESFVRISRSESTTRNLAGKDQQLADLALAVSDAIVPGRRDSVLEALQKADPTVRDRVNALFSRKEEVVNNFNLQNATDIQINQDTHGPVTKTSTNVQAASKEQA
jgi:hypothetical protein